MYYPALKANVDFFLKPMYLDINEDLRLMPFSNPNKEVQAYFENSSTNEIKKEIPGAYVETFENAIERIPKLINSFIMKQHFLYNIVLVDYSLIIGHIMLETPLSQNPIKEWNINFWINNDWANRGIVTIAVRRLLKYLYTMQISKLYAFVSFENQASKRVLAKTGFKQISKKDTNGNELYSYEFD